MALPSSGQITLAQIAAEFGGSAPHSLSEYYRGGGLVPDTSANAGVPTSGQISLSNFYGASAADLVPNAVNWADIAGDAPGPIANANQTISGISAAINITAAYVPDVGGSITLQYSKNGGAFTNYTGAISMANGDTLRWQASSGSPQGGVVTVRNASDSNTVLDTFRVDLLDPL